MSRYAVSLPRWPGIMTPPGKVELVLPETGVCSGTGLAEDAGVTGEGGCGAGVATPSAPLSVSLNPIGG